MSDTIETLVGKFALEALVGTVVKTIQKGISKIISDAENAFRRGSFGIRSDLLILMQNFEYEFKEIQEKALNNISDAQKSILNDALFILEKYSETGFGILKEVRELNTKFADTIIRLPFVNKDPRVYSSHPNYVVFNKGGEYFITIKGSLLGKGVASLTFLNNTCELVERDEETIKYMLKNENLACGETIKHNTGELTLQWDSGIIGNVIDKILGRTPANKLYKIALAVVPETIGMYEVHATVRKEYIETRDSEKYFRHQNDHCEGPHWPGDWIVNADIKNDWIIDVNSINIKEEFVSANSKVMGPVEITSGSFRISAKVGNVGECGPLWKDGRGELAVKAFYKEIKKGSAIETVLVRNGVLKWGSDENFELPPNTISVSFALTPIVISNEQRIVASRSDDYDLFSMEIDLAAGKLIVRPKDVDKALSDF